MDANEIIVDSVKNGRDFSIPKIGGTAASTIVEVMDKVCENMSDTETKEFQEKVFQDYSIFEEEDSIYLSKK